MLKMKKDNLEKIKSDVVFLCGSKKERVPAFKQILASFNDVFMEMFSGELQNEAEILIPEFNAIDFKGFLNYLYFHEVDFKKSNAFSLYMLGHKYMVPALCDLCSDEICKYVSLWNVFEALEWNQIYEDQKIFKRLKEFFCENAIGCLKVNEGFKGLSKSSIMVILKWENTRCSEELLYQNLLKWADDQLEKEKKQKTLANKKGLLKCLLDYIRLKIYSDLAYDPLYTSSRYHWKTSVTNFEKSTTNRWNFDHFNTDCRSICYGFKMPLSNLISTSDLTERFSFWYTCGGFEKYTKVESFEVSIAAGQSFLLKDIYLKNPIILEKSKARYRFGVKFVDSRLRIVPTSNKYIHRGENSYIFAEKFIPEIHNVFV